MEVNIFQVRGLERTLDLESESPHIKILAFQLHPSGLVEIPLLRAGLLPTQNEDWEFSI